MSSLQQLKSTKGGNFEFKKHISCFMGCISKHMVCISSRGISDFSQVDLI